jgi:hypothetical protein
VIEFLELVLVYIHANRYSYRLSPSPSNTVLILSTGSLRYANDLRKRLTQENWRNWLIESRSPIASSMTSLSPLRKFFPLMESAKSSRSGLCERYNAVCVESSRLKQCSMRLASTDLVLSAIDRTSVSDLIFVSKIITYHCIWTRGLPDDSLSDRLSAEVAIGCKPRELAAEILPYRKNSRRDSVVVY